MKKNSLSDLGSEQLVTKKKSITNAIFGFGTVLLLSFLILLYFAIANKNFKLIPIGVGCLLTLIPLFIARNQLNTEIKSRESEYVK